VCVWECAQHSECHKRKKIQEKELWKRRNERKRLPNLSWSDFTFLESHYRFPSRVIATDCLIFNIIIVIIMITIVVVFLFFWHVMLSRLLEVYRKFGGTCCFHLHVWRISQAIQALCNTHMHINSGSQFPSGFFLQIYYLKVTNGVLYIAHRYYIPKFLDISELVLTWPCTFCYEPQTFPVSNFHRLSFHLCRFVRSSHFHSLPRIKLTLPSTVLPKKLKLHS
jgi:hypothetical protein